MKLYVSRYRINSTVDPTGLLNQMSSVAHELKVIGQTENPLACEFWMKDKILFADSEYERTLGQRLDEAERKNWYRLHKIIKSYKSYMIVENIPSGRGGSSLLTAISSSQGSLESITALVHSLYQDKEVRASDISSACFVRESEHVVQSCELYNHESKSTLSWKFGMPTSLEKVFEHTHESSSWQLLRVVIAPHHERLPLPSHMINIDLQANRAEFLLDESVLARYDKKDRIERLRCLAGMLFDVEVAHAPRTPDIPQPPGIVEVPGAAARAETLEVSATRDRA